MMAPQAINLSASLRRIPERKPAFASMGRSALAAMWLLGAVLPGVAQEAVVDLAALDDLPEVRHLAASLADPDSRMDTLFTMAVVARLLDNAAALDPGQIQGAVEQFRDDRAWLDRLAARYLDMPMRSTVLDPAAWLIVQELDQQQLESFPLISPLGPDLHVLLPQLFDRSEEQLAAALLPEALVRLELRSVELWLALHEAASGNETLLAVVAGLNADWFDPWMAAGAPAPLAPQVDALQEARRLLSIVASTATLPAAPDELSLKRLRFSLLAAQGNVKAERRPESAHLLRLASAVESLYQHRFLSFAETLLWVVADVLDGAGAPDSAVSPVAPMLAELLPRISSAYARAFAQVDPRINAAMAAAFDVVQNLQSGNLTPERLRALSLELADAVAQVVLMIPDMDYYFGQPVRARVGEEIDVCISIAAARNPDGESSLTREQFDRCMEGMVQLIGRDARGAELAGDADGPFGTDHLARELALPPWQRINYVLGYLHKRYPAVCVPPEQPLPNPLEWSALATLMAWFAERSPVYFQTPSNERLVLQMRQHGLDLLHDLSRQADCFSGAGGGLNDPVSRTTQDYHSSLVELARGIREKELEFRSAHLNPGADVMLSGDANQRTAYRSEGMMISACNAERSCGMDGKLEATRALVGLFPDPYLIADQSGLGAVEICYDNVQWVERRSEPVRPDDPHVANYFGRLSFELIGRYVENGTVSDVFGSRFLSPREYHYLFAAMNDEILADPCPLEWVGSRIVIRTNRPRGVSIVPDRLTYLAAARRRPVQLLAANWSQGAEWRDWFVTGIGVTGIEFDGDPTIKDRVGQHLQALYQAQQAALYAALLQLPGQAAKTGGGDLHAMLQAVSNRKAALRAAVSLFYPNLLLDSDSTRGALEGYGGLLDEAVMSRFRDANAPVASISEAAMLRLEQFRADWSKLPESVRRSGSASNSVAHALTRLNALYREFFALPLEGSASIRQTALHY